MTYLSGKIGKTSECFQTIDFEDRLSPELPMIKLTTVRHQGVCEIGCAESRYIDIYMSTSTTLRSEYTEYIGRLDTAGLTADLQLESKIECTRAPGDFAS